MVFARTSLLESEPDSLSDHVELRIRRHRNRYILEGILLMAFGVLAAGLPAIATLDAAFLLGVVLFTTGIVQFTFTIKAQRHFWSLLSACLFIFAGLFIFWRPLDVLMVIVTLAAMFLSLEGSLEILLAFEFRPVRNWIWMYLSGSVTLCLSLLLWMALPVIGFYVGWLIAINLILYGFSLLMLGWAQIPQSKIVQIRNVNPKETL